MNTVISKDCTSIAYDRTGKGPAVILVGGALTQRADLANLAALLAPRFTVISYDRRGRGDSGDTAPYAIEREVEDLEALIDEAGGIASVYGHSSGAALALEAACMLRAKIRKLALYEPPFNAGGSGAPSPMEHVAQLKQLLATGRQGDMLEYWMKNVTGMPAEVVASMKGSPMWQGLLPVTATLIYDETIMGKYEDPARRIKGITQPTLALDGGASPAWAARSSQLLVSTLPNVQRRTLAGQTHGVDPKILAPALIEFFGK